LPVGAEIFDIIIKAKSPLVPYIRTKPIHISQDFLEEFEDKSQTFKLKLILNYELKSTFLSYGNDLEVLEPKELRAELKNVYMGGSDMYR